ncbi:MAG: NAD(P)-binding domain-containing protein [Propionicimonas sp.]|nr:NAD(P)-binding domain-containing protein [Propionicimonas sp.]
MRTAVLGTGTVGRAWAARLAELGHEVVVGTRDPSTTLERDAGAWDGFALVPFAEAVVGADLVVNALNGRAALDVLPALADALDGVVVADISNPLDFSGGFPPTLFVKDTDSLGEQLQRALPRARLVKTLNTVTASLQVHPPAEGTVFVAGDDADARALMTRVLTEVGHSDVVDLGDLAGARGVEMYLPLWLRLWQVLGTAEFTIKVVRPPS